MVHLTYYFNSVQVFFFRVRQHCGHTYSPSLSHIRACVALLMLTVHCRISHCVKFGGITRKRKNVYCSCSILIFLFHYQSHVTRSLRIQSACYILRCTSHFNFFECLRFLILVLLHRGTDCWFIAKGKVYDVTRWISLDLHPGGNAWYVQQFYVLLMYFL